MECDNACKDGHIGTEGVGRVENAQSPEPAINTCGFENWPSSIRAGMTEQLTVYQKY